MGPMGYFFKNYIWTRIMRHKDALCPCYQLHKLDEAMTFEIQHIA